LGARAQSTSRDTIALRLVRDFSQVFDESHPIPACFRPAVRVLTAFVWAGGLLAGCAMFEMTPQSATQPTALSWLTNWVSQPMEMAPGFDVELIKPEPRPAAVAADNLLEITVWDLYEPGKPYSFPVRVSNRLTIEAPFLGEVPVQSRTIQEIEADLRSRFRDGEYLLNPRILVRSLDAPLLKIQVTGAVNRGGFVELTRTDPSVYAAILSAGGLKKTAGTEVAVVRRTVALAKSAANQHETRSHEPNTVISSAPADMPPANAVPAPSEPHAPAQRANSVDELSVPPTAPGPRPAGADRRFGRGYYFVGEEQNVEPPAINPSITVNPGRAPLGSLRDADAKGGSPLSAAGEQIPSTVWYDMALARDRELLKAVQLADGDSVTVKAATPPLRIGGFVNRPGAYPLPPGRILNVWQAIDLAGGMRDVSVPVNITLLRPAGEGRGAQRWYLSVPAYDKHPSTSPSVEHGDVLHVEPTTGSKIKRAVGDLWNKP
jgi:protein involved in polysaccharide export with SLBB domain